VDNLYDDIIDQLRTDFVDEAEDNLNVIDITLENIRSGEPNHKEALIKIRRAAHSLKGSSSVVEFALVTLVMHRFEDYLNNLESLTPEQIEDAQVFSDKAREFSTIEFDQKSIPQSELSRALPHKRIEGLDTPEDAEKHWKIEVLLVMKERTSALIFERELRAAGLRVNTINKSFEALKMAVKTKPDMLIASGVIDELSGIDLISAIGAMPTTKDIPICLLTSFEKGHHELEDMPHHADVINKSNLKIDLIHALRKHNLIKS